MGGSKLWWLCGAGRQMEFTEESAVAGSGSDGPVHLQSVLPVGADFHDNPGLVPAPRAVGGLVLDGDGVPDSEQMEVLGGAVVAFSNISVSSGKGGFPHGNQ